jgi:hypothetical protein
VAIPVRARALLRTAQRSDRCASAGALASKPELVSRGPATSEQELGASLEAPPPAEEFSERERLARIPWCRHLIRRGSTVLPRCGLGVSAFPTQAVGPPAPAGEGTGLASSPSPS